MQYYSCGSIAIIAIIIIIMVFVRVGVLTLVIARAEEGQLNMCQSDDTVERPGRADRMTFTRTRRYEYQVPYTTKVWSHIGLSGA